jgi:FkbM family methyltransferase
VRILGRPWQWWAQAPLESAHYVGIWNAFRVYRRPAHDLYRYLSGRGTYPYICRIRTPIGDISVELGSWHDMLTVTEVFCRLDYKAETAVETIVDIGSNIGVSALYFLSRNQSARCYLVEPDPKNVARLERNLAPFAERYTLKQCAVSDTTGMVEFGVEPSGRYGGIGREFDQSIFVPCRHINDVLEEVTAVAGRVNILKIDTEGLEARTVKAIRPDLLRHVDVVYLESLETLEPLHPEWMAQTRRLATWRLVPRDKRHLADIPTEP